MAGSFHIFRRNQKLMLAILTLMAMFAFVFLDPLLKYISQSQQPANPVLVETKYGNLKRSDIENLKASRMLVENFLKVLAQQTVQKLTDQGLLDARYPQQQEMYIKQLQSGYLAQVMRSQQPTQAQDVVDTMLLARKAQAMNVVISNEAVTATLEDLTRKSVAPAEMSKIIRNMRASERQFFDAMRNELAATTVVQNFNISLQGTPPAELWDYYCRVNQKASIEFVALPVADFADEVKDPGDAELKAFFEKYKDQLPVPGSPEPGFRLPKRQKFQFFEAELDLFRETAEVTEEEIKKYYEENQQSFRKVSLPADKPKAEASSEKPTPENPEPNTEKPASPDAAAPTNPAPEKSEPEKPTAEQPAVPKESSPTSKKSTSVTPSQKPSSAVKFQFVAQKTEKNRDEKPTGSGKQETGPALSPPAKVSEKKVEATPKADQPPTTPDTVNEEDKSTKPAEPAASEKPAEKTEEPAPQYESLEDVREQITRTLKVQKAREKISEAINKLTAEVSAYDRALTIYENNKQNDPSAKAPKEPNFVELAKKQNVKFGETKLASYWDFVSDKGLGASRYESVPFADMTFRQATPQYTPLVTENNDGNVFLSWKVEDAEDKVPTFDEVREDVLRTWKLIQARDLAKKQAEEFAKRANSEKKPLSQVFTAEDGPKVAKAGPFSWLTMGTTADFSRGRMPMLNEVPGIESPGADFMKTIFGLKSGEAGVAVNAPKDTCYVVQIEEYSPPLKELEADFARENLGQYQGVARIEQGEIARDWFAKLEQDADVKWLQPPSTIE